MIHFSSFFTNIPLREAALALALVTTGCASDATRAAVDNGREVQDDLQGDDDGETLHAEADAAPDAARSDAGSAGAGLPDGSTRAPAIDPELEALRQTCVDEINRYRATLSLPPLARASDREECSDKGAQLDGDSGRAHASATAGGSRGSNGYCPSSAQDACPGWGVGGRSGNATVAVALKGCLKMMWDEGPPPSGPCTGACYQAHGHYLNMSATGTKRVACGFYKMKNGTYWMNQNFW